MNNTDYARLIMQELIILENYEAKSRKEKILVTKCCKKLEKDLFDYKK